ncbi:neogenin-like [Diadema setosum]|uniref:neogenin-like n=1 Tax=Diadema setosum TaxID=31175 RepID=UPI003B3A2CE3
MIGRGRFSLLRLASDPDATTAHNVGVDLVCDSDFLCRSGVAVMLQIDEEPVCGAPASSEHAIIELCAPPFTSGTICRYTCELGYRRREGSPLRICEPRVKGWLGKQLICERVNPVQEPGGSCNVDLEFLDRPVSRQSFENDLIQLDCVVSDPNAEIAWYKDGQRLRSGSVPGIFIQSANDLLIIPAFDLTHEGQYACLALVNGTECLRADLNITFNTMGFFAQTPEDAFAEEGEEHLFQCVPEDPTYDVTWFKGDERISIGDADVIQIPGGGLILRNLELEDEGKYTCVLTDVEGRVKARAHALLFLADPPIPDIPNQCEALVTPDHVIAGPCSPPFTAGTLCTHECEPGYRRTGGSARRICEPAVGWLGIQLTCEEGRAMRGTLVSPQRFKLLKYLISNI